MAEQKCPMCGKLNPPEADVCQFCEARLKPLIINQPDESQNSASLNPSTPSSKEEAAPDWLRSLRDRQNEAGSESDEEDLLSWPSHEEDESPGQPSGDEAAVPNWLDSLRDPDNPEDEAFLDAGQDDVEDEPDREEDVWAPSGLDASDESSVPDWLSGMRTSPESSDEEREVLSQEIGDEGPDWLERIRSRQQAEIPAGDAPPEQQQDLPDWLRSDDLSTAGTMADWPSSIRDRDEEAPVDWEQAQPPAESQEALPDWLPDIKQELDEDASPDELPSWLKQDDVEPAQASADETPDWLEGEEEAIPPADEFPDWLETGELEPDEQEIKPRQADWMASSSLAAESAAGENIDWLAGEAEASPVDQVPDWLQPAGETSGSEEEPPAPDGPSLKMDAEPAEGLPDWLQQADQETGESQAEEAPDWLAKGADEAALPEGAQEAPRGELPDWLPEPSAEEETPEGIPGDRAAEDLPEWLAALDHEIEADIAEAAGEAPDLSAEPADELPEWLAGIGPMLADAGEESSDEAQETGIILADVSAGAEEDEYSILPGDESFEGEVPEWLADVKAGEEALEPEAAGQVGPKEADLAPAELPSWLEAMRPVETEAAPETLDERDRLVVSVGPLIGLSGVLPAETGISKVQKPPTYSVKLHVSDMQQERASMLGELIQAEGVSRPIPGRPLVSSQNLLRIIFGLILFLAILWPLIADGPVAPVPVFTPETAAANQLIGQINSQDPVLVAVDYQPGLSGEMDAIASTLFDHLMLRGAYLTLVSTTASGPIQAEHVIELSNQQFGHSYVGAGEYTNLGYIPGGPTGLISFVANPRAMMAYALDDGRPAWENSPLQDIQNISEFALVTVITENPETARAWIEQVQPELGDTAMIMAISAQAEPMVRPYYEAFPKQVQGMVVGLAGSVSYESLLGRQGLSLDYWNSFGVGLLVAIALIFVGGVFNMIPIFLKGGRENSAEREGSR